MKHYTRWARVPEWALPILEYGFSDTDSEEDVAAVLTWRDQVGYIAFGWADDPGFTHTNDITSLGNTTVDMEYLSSKRIAPSSSACPHNPTRYQTRVWEDGTIDALFVASYRSASGTYRYGADRAQIYSSVGHTGEFWPGDETHRSILRRTRPGNAEEVEYAGQMLRNCGYRNWGYYRPTPVKRLKP